VFSVQETIRHIVSSGYPTLRKTRPKTVIASSDGSLAMRTCGCTIMTVTDWTVRSYDVVLSEGSTPHLAVSHNQRIRRRRSVVSHFT
jgi:hypothetical protein